jgi:hypothetical protein
MTSRVEPVGLPGLVELVEPLELVGAGWTAITLTSFPASQDGG